MNEEVAAVEEKEVEKNEGLLEEDESLRDEGEDEELEFHWGPEEDDACCEEPMDLVPRVIIQVAMVSANEMEHLSMHISRSRDALYEIISKDDLGKEKVKEKMKAIQEFIAAAEHRTNELTGRIETLLKKEPCSCTK